MKFRQSFYARSLGVTVLWSSLIALPGIASAQIVISEIMYDAPGADTKAEWVELENTGDVAVDISKWKFRDASSHVLNAPPKNGSTGSLVMAPGDFLILAADANTFEASHSVGASVIDTVMNLSNDRGTIELLDASSTVENKVSYTSSKGGNGTGESLQMINGKLVAGAPTPGAENSSARLSKASSVSIVSKTSAKKVATKAKPQILDGASTSAADYADAQEPSTTAMAAAAVVPVVTSSGSLMAWLYGVLALSVAGGGAALVARQKKKGEWDIEEIA